MNLFIHHHSFKASKDSSKRVYRIMLLQYEYNNSEKEIAFKEWINHIRLIPNLLNNVVIHISTPQFIRSMCNKSHFLCVPVPLCPADLVPVEK